MSRSQIGHWSALTRSGLSGWPCCWSGDQASAEDVVQEAFLGLYRNWPSLSDYDRLPGYLRVAVVNGSRGVLRARRRA